MFGRLALLVALGAAAGGIATACGGETAQAPLPRLVRAGDAPRPPRHPVVVSIVVDQLAAWVLAERASELPADGGFARLVKGGTWVKDLRYMHSATDTAPGHASLYTGKTPSEHGIFANEIPRGGKNVTILRDAHTKVVGANGVIDRPSSSIAQLRVATVADDLRAQNADALTFSISLKDRGAIFGGGRKPTESLWYDSESGAFVTSTAFDNALLVWAARAGSHAEVANSRAVPWTLSDEAWVKSHAKTADDAPGEGDLDGLGIAFPHLAKTNKAFRATPAADTMLATLGWLALRDGNAGDHGALLAISFSANDYIGHTFGPDSWEAWDELRRLDHTLAWLFTMLDAMVGENGYAVVLSGDHGTFTMPEAASPATQPWCTSGGEDVWRRPCGAGKRIVPDELAHAMDAAATKALGEGPWVEGIADPYFYLTLKAKALAAPERKKLDDALEKSISEFAGTALDRVYTHATLESACKAPRAPWDESLEALVCNAFTDSAGDGYIVLSPGSFFDGGVVVGKGTGHGTPWLYDRSVPLLVYAPGKVAAGATVAGPVRFSAFARTLRALLGVTAEPVDDVLRRETRPPT
jgi:hypothetical protein